VELQKSIGLGDDYRYRFEPEAKERFLDLFRERFNSAVRYNGRALKWDTVIEQKALELGRFLWLVAASRWVHCDRSRRRRKCCHTLRLA
jgi:hypothetical protein